MELDPKLTSDIKYTIGTFSSQLVSYYKIGAITKGFTHVVILVGTIDAARITYRYHARALHAHTHTHTYHSTVLRKEDQSLLFIEDETICTRLHCH